MSFKFSSRNLNAVLFASTALVSAVAVSSAVAGTVSGSVTDASGTSALRGAEVVLVELGQTATVQADGSFRFASVPAGTYSLRVRYTGAEDQTQSITVAETGDVSAQFALKAVDGDVVEVLIVGQRANLSSSISRQRSSDTVQTTLSKDSMGQFPDQNVAEAMRRATGVNVLNDQGEGRFVSVRGLDPNLNSASINGNRILSTGGDDRSVAMDVIPAELIESIDIKKSLTPDMDGDTIGASIEINTVSAFDRKKDMFSATLEGSYNDQNEETSPKAGLDFSKKLTDNLGVAGGLSYYKRKFATDNIEAADWDGSGDAAFARTLEYRDYDVERERYGFTLNFDYRVSENTSLYLRSFYSKFDDTELRNRLIFKIDDLNPTAADNKATFLSGSGSAGRIEIRRDIKDRREWQETSNIAFGGKTFLDAWKFTYDLSYSTASQSEDGSIDPMRFRARYQQGANQIGVTFDYNDLTRPSYAVTTGAAIFNDPTRYTMTAYERTSDESAEDEELALRFDAARTMNLSQGTFEVKFGGKVRQRDKSLDMTYDIYDGYDGDLTLADVAGTPTYGLADIGVVPDLGKVRNLASANAANFERSDIDSEIASTVEDYDGSEDIYAGYVQGRYDNGALRVIGGVRVEQTKLSMSGTTARTIDDDGDVTFVVSPVAFKKDYTDVLPSVNVRYNVNDKLVARAAVSQSLMRPSFGKMAPRFVLEENVEDNEVSAVFGNPDLDPYKATNFDASLEYYFAKEGVIQGGIFAKKIKDFIVDFSTDDAGVYNGVAYDEAEYAINGGEADVFGVELAYSQAFTFLASPWDGLLVSANYTYTDAEGDVNGRTIPLPASAKQTANLVLGYEKGPLSLRAAGAYRSGYLDELGGSAEEDRYIKDHFQLDLSAKYKVTDNVRVFAELVNANDATYTAYNNFGGRQRLLQYEEYSWTTKFGVKFNY
ncbi:TonB-dependent receptor [Asticcacaulis sp. SL142]|uniref:TonB-dependent receptor n=1 Tax=Asticcacaulis sp. SL142 TaxID=2995155 RepID=UPI00226C93BE|nr:TonB-dependent receptor [Asticcacaulis sp. SL142]WAC48567.1 TonB-dependent receptor [Asticcacaulis sp. SL142]